MINSMTVTDAELELYCDLLRLAYHLYAKQHNGWSCGTGAEKLRNEMFDAIKAAGIIDKTA